MASLDQKASHWLVKTSIYSLTRLSHRGAVAQDGKTGDGCGILVAKPDKFFRNLAKDAKVNLAKNYAVAVLFLNQNRSLASSAIARLTKELRELKLELAWERVVPIDPSACGEDASHTLPVIVQVFVNAPDNLDEDEFERKLFVARRKTELALEEKDSSFYIASFSSKLVSYKGMIMPNYLTVFYPDLIDERFESALCLYHQRFSTNTFPEWRLAQPFRLLAHNGEINTVNGNRNWSSSRESKYSTPLIPNFQELLPLVSKDGSDSMSLDNILESLIVTGVNLLQAIRILVPPAWQNAKFMDPDLRAMYEFYSLYMDPWDGPAGLVLTDGNYAACAMDRNGLRPARYVITKDRHITIASEIGVYDYAPEDVVSKGKLKPGEMIAVDLKDGALLSNDEINDKLKSISPYQEWLKRYTKYLKQVPEEEEPGCDPIFDHELTIYEKQFQLTIEERDQILKSIAETGQEALGSMGDDTPLAVLSEEIRPLYEYFRQQFAQVTNPPIDPIRESMVMSLKTCLGKEFNPFVESSHNATRIEIESPVLSRLMFKSLLQPDDTNYAYETIDLTYPKDSDLQSAVLNICEQAEQAVINGKVFLILTDRRLRRNRIPIHALLATGAIHSRLCEKGLRCDANIIIETATARDPHHFAALIGFGATAIYPYLAYQTLYDLVKRNHIICTNTVELMQSYRTAIDKGLYKILSKMGISTINSYRGAQLFEIIGLHEEIVEICFPGTVSRIQGATFKDLDTDMRILSAEAWNSNQALRPGGLLKFYPHAEYHAFNPDVVTTLQVAARTGDYSEYKKFSSLVQNRPYTALRDMLGLKPNRSSISIDEVEPVETILKRFCSAAMSVGALSPEAHEALAIAMNRIGASSVSGEGGEDSIRYGTEKNSNIKQVASGRFGVTPEYLVNCDGLQIKIAQGAKPGEGGQLPGYKVNELIARLRYTKPGTTLISPPPHHDIYSIEDLAQLIFDLKQVNPKADVSVKLVAEAGVGTVAAGVAKSYADSITISGHDGGTGASPITSIRYAGAPWELGLTEAHQVLRSNNLRDKVKLQTDGGLKTGYDVVKAAILGAESFGFGTTLLITLGCKYLKICHLNNCATGVATQNPILRDKHFKGLPELAETYLRFVAQEIREILSYLGVKELRDIIGQTELLERLPARTEKQKNLSLDVLLTELDSSMGKPNYALQSRNPPNDKAELAEKMLAEALPFIERKEKQSFNYQIKNQHRSIGARVSGEIARKFGDKGLASEITFNFKGIAGQSFGAWNINGLNLILEGDANDYVGKGMNGGKIVIYPAPNSKFETQVTPIAGNTCLYGATGGKFFAAGIVGERFAVRNSGARAVVEGLGDHGCEYMTAGLVVSLGKVGLNFGAGMTGGLAFVLDDEDLLVQNYNPELIELLRIDLPEMSRATALLKNTIEEFVAETQSAWAKNILNNFTDRLKSFWLVKPKTLSLEIINEYETQSVSRIA